MGLSVRWTGTGAPGLRGRGRRSAMNSVATSVATSVAASILGLALLVPAPALAAAPPPTEAPAPGPVETDEEASPEPRPEPDTEASPDSTRRSVLGERGRSWVACSPSTTPCIRPRPARALLLSLGLVGGAVASALLFGLGDRLAPADPATLLVGLSGLAGAGALVGMLAGRLGADGPAAPDRLRPPTAGLAYAYSGRQVLDESRPHSLSLR